MGFEGKICGVSILRAGEVGWRTSVTVFRVLISSVSLLGYGGRFARSMQERPHRKDSYSKGIGHCFPFENVTDTTRLG